MPSVPPPETISGPAPPPPPPPSRAADGAVDAPAAAQPVSKLPMAGQVALPNGYGPGQAAAAAALVAPAPQATSPFARTALLPSPRSPVKILPLSAPLAPAVAISLPPASAEASSLPLTQASVVPPPVPSPKAPGPTAAAAPAAPPVDGSSQDVRPPPIADWTTRPYAVRPDSPVKGVILRDNSPRAAPARSPTLGETLQAARQLRSDQEDILAALSPTLPTPAALPAVQELVGQVSAPEAASTPPVALALVEKRLPEKLPQEVPTHDRPAQASSHNDVQPSSTVPLPPQPQPSSPPPRAGHVEVPAVSARQEPTAAPSPAPSQPVSSLEASSRASLPTPPKSPPPVERVRVKKEPVVTAPLPGPSLRPAAAPAAPAVPPAVPAVGARRVKVEADAVDEAEQPPQPSSPAVKSPRPSRSSHRLATVSVSAAASLDSAAASDDESQVNSGRALKCKSCNPPLVFSSMSERNLHQRCVSLFSPPARSAALDS